MKFNFWKRKSESIIESSTCVRCVHYRPTHCPYASRCLTVPGKPYCKPKETHDISFRNADKQKVKQSPMVEKKDLKSDFLKIFKQLTNRHGTWSIWSDAICMFAYSISNAVDKSNYDKREAQYMNIIKKYNKKERDLFQELLSIIVMALEENPEQDFLGSIFMELGISNSNLGQVFTPYSVCRLMSEVSLSNIRAEIKDNDCITIADFTCGSGATLISSINVAKEELMKDGLNYQKHILVAARDIDYTAALMCYIQLSLLGVAAYIKVGDSISEPMTKNDSIDSYWFTPVYILDGWKYRRMGLNNGY